MKVGIYRPQGKFSRSEYFTERIITLKAMQPPLMDDEIATCLLDHFEELIQDTRRVQRIKNIIDFLTSATK